MHKYDRTKYEPTAKRYIELKNGTFKLKTALRNFLGVAKKDLYLAVYRSDHIR